LGELVRASCWALPSELAEFSADLERIAGVLLVEDHQQPAQQQQR
jgi:hypothetical protein